ncbi:MAG: hypothetical protein Q9221_007320 [Calogaya cf. arnoldii]
MKHLSIVAVLALLGSSSAIPQNVPGGRLFAPGSRGDRGGGAPGASAAEKHFENEELMCSGDMSTPYNKTCWDTLGVANYILKWEQDTPKCPPGNNTCIKTGCIDKEPWSSCFLRLATGTPDYNCAQINIGHCTLEGFPLKDLDSIDMPMIRYTARNIFALTVGLPFLSLPAVGALVPAATSMVGTLLVTALQQAPAVTEAIWPKPDGKSTQVIQMGELASELADVNGQLGEMLDRGLAVVMKDLSSFVKLASSGTFSGPDVLSIPKKTAKLDLALKAHLVSKAMTANDWWVYYGPPDNDDGTWSNSTTESNSKKYVCNVTPEDDICDLIDSHGVPPLCQPED